MGTLLSLLPSSIMVWSSDSDEELDNTPQAMMARYRKQQEQATFSAKNRISEGTFDTADKTKYAKKKSKKPKWGGFSVWSSTTTATRTTTTTGPNHPTPTS